MNTKLKHLNIQYYTPINHSGISTAARSYIDLLYKMGHNIKIMPEGNRIIYFDDKDKEKYAALVNNDINNFDLTIVHTYPLNFAGYRKPAGFVGGLPTLFLYAWELNSYPDNLAEVIKTKADYSATFCPYQVELYKKLIGENVKYIPHIVNKSAYSKKSWGGEDFTFITINDWVARKHPDAIIAAYLMEFNKEDKVNLIVKTPAKVSQERFTNIVKQIASSYHITNVPKLSFINESLSADGMDELWKKADCAVSSSHGEGWGFLFSDAISHGVPVIYPKSNLIPNIFFDETNSVPVDTYEDYVRGFEFGKLPEKTTWSSVYLMDLAKKMRRVYEDHEKMFKLPVDFPQSFKEDQNSIEEKMTELLELTIKNHKG